MFLAQCSMSLKVCPQCSAVVSVRKCVVTVKFLYNRKVQIPDDRKDIYYRC